MGHTADKMTETPPVQDQGVTRSGNGANPTVLGGAVGNAESAMKSRAEKNFDAMNEARAAMGLPKLPYPDKK
jgi:hypothetical protein